MSIENQIQDSVLGARDVMRRLDSTEVRSFRKLLEQQADRGSQICIDARSILQQEPDITNQQLWLRLGVELPPAGPDSDDLEVIFF